MELALPITVYWDLSPDAISCDYISRLSSEILECRLLMLQLYDPSLELSDAALSIIEQFKGKQVAVTLTISNSSFLSVSADSNPELAVKEILIACDGLESLKEYPPSEGVGLSFFVNSKNWTELPEVISFCRKNGISRLVLPMQRLYAGEEPFFLNRQEQKRLETALAEAGGTEGLKLTIHDPFLWRAFNPSTPFPQGGCQAANTMIAISPDGGVYPCPTLPVRLDGVGDKTLKEIVASSAKKDIRRRILETPSACSSCQELPVCKGGCRGRSLVMHTSFDYIDDACK
ncbi:MAG: GeoRSP system SPASM domain protein [Desulfuromonadaceae bacterium]|nr:GeoRSP system SPASM domain protein [Desulfuromonadaceae bacterium]MDD2856162.1 GeoRSP system SPASM domain protein [Desulfuromonadaceae bacterium]